MEHAEGLIKITNIILHRRPLSFNLPMLCLGVIWPHSNGTHQLFFPSSSKYIKKKTKEKYSLGYAIRFPVSFLAKDVLL